MMRSSFFSVVIALGMSPLMTQGAPDISMDVTRFATDSIHYIELSMYIVGSTLTCEESTEHEYGVTYIVFVRDDQDQIVSGNRYRLSRQGCPAKDIIDIRRFILPPGSYTVAVEASDLYDTLDVVHIQQDILIEPFAKSASISDIQLLSRIKSEPDVNSPLHKSGVYMEPLPFRLYYPALEYLYLYLETYQTDVLKGQPYLQYTIKPQTGEIPVPIVTFKKVPKEPITAQVFQLDISTLISGPYWLEAALFDGEKQIQSVRKIEFSRFNPKGDSLFMETGMLNLDLGFVKNIPEDSLSYILRAMAPIVGSSDVDIMNALLQKGGSKAQRYFIHRFWTQEAGKHAGPAFHGYMKVAKAIDDAYRSGFGYGFETDRGHIFLKYGKPDDLITVEDEPSAPPYEIWFYNTFPATRQNNVRFLFYNPSLVKNGHKLLHSTAIGEVKNERWEIELYRDATMETPGVNERVMGDNVHRNARKYFEY